MANLGCSFDVASYSEIEYLKAIGVHSRDLLYSNTSKSDLDVLLAHRAEVNRFVSHSKEDLVRLARYSPGAEIIVRMSADCGDKVVFPHKGRFGAAEAEIGGLFDYAASLGLKPVGIHAHHGSENKDPVVWEATIQKMATIIRNNRVKHPTLRVMDISGGFASPNSIGSPAPEEFGKIIEASIEKHIGTERAKFDVIAEPGRIIVSDTALTFAEVIEVKPSNLEKGTINITTNAGPKTAGLQEPGVTVLFARRQGNGSLKLYNSIIKFTEDSTGISIVGRAMRKANFYDPTCDDFRARVENPEAPMDIRKGDIVLFCGTGAYCNTLLQTEFNSQIGPLELVLKPAVQHSGLPQKRSFLSADSHSLSYQLGQSQSNLEKRDALRTWAEKLGFVSAETKELLSRDKEKNKCFDRANS